MISRADLKSDLLQELERQKRMLASLHNNPAISEQALDAILADIERASADLLAMSGKIGQHLRENEWLMGIKQRAVMPGGTCEFDLPSYHYWQAQDLNIRREICAAWLAPMLPSAYRVENHPEAVARKRQGVQLHRAPGHLPADAGRTGRADAAHPPEQGAGCIPEVGANKYAINIRFIAANYAAKSTLFEQDVPFELTFCSIST